MHTNIHTSTFERKKILIPQRVIRRLDRRERSRKISNTAFRITRQSVIFGVREAV